MVYAMPLTLLVVDDDPDILALMQMDFELMGFAVETAKNGAEALRKLEQPLPVYDGVLLDVMMPQVDGFDVCKRLRQLPHREETPVILLTAKGQLEDKVRGFHAGADDYLVKPFEIQELMVRMRALFRRSGKLATLKPNGAVTASSKDKQERLGFGAMRLLPTSLEVHWQGQLVRLTPTEFELLYCLMQHVNEPVTLATLLKEVWGYEPDEDVRMVRVHIGGLRQKLEQDAKQPTLIETVNNIGYRLTLLDTID
jgi:two-component system, OmpR family, response regulator RpaA